MNCRGGMANAEGEELAQDLLGQGGKDRGVHPEPDRRQSVGARAILWNLRHLRVFGSIAYVHVPKEKRRKLDAKAEKCILGGYSDEQNGCV